MPLVEREIIDFIGPEGAGKSTIAKKLSSETEKLYVSVGDILRDMAKNDQTELGDECRAMFKEHRYLDPSMLLLIQTEYFKKEEFSEGFILDGGLRTKTEVLGFLGMLENAGRKMPLTVIYLKVPEEVSVQRLTGKNGRNREDDTLEGVSNRLKHFYDKLDERISLITTMCLLLHIDATGTVDETFDRVRKALIERSI